MIGNVFHKPALGSSFAQRNIVKGKKFSSGMTTTLWSMVSTFLAFFNAGQSKFNYGNSDLEWHRGCLMTAKAKDLWKPLPWCG